MHSHMLMPNWLSLFLLTLPQLICAFTVASLNASQHIQHYRGSLLAAKSLTKVNGGKQFFFADVNTKIHAKVGTKAELPCLVYGIDLSNVVVSL